MPNFPLQLSTAQNPKQAPKNRNPQNAQTNRRQMAKFPFPRQPIPLPFYPPKGQKNIYKKLAHAFKLKFAHQAAVLSVRG